MPLSHTIEEIERKYDELCNDTSALAGLTGGRRIYVKSFLLSSLRRVLEGVRGEIGGMKKNTRKPEYIEKWRASDYEEVGYNSALDSVSSLIEGEMEKLK